MRVGYLGPAGTYSHEAALQEFGGHELVGLANLQGVVDGVIDGHVDRAVLPVENCTNGEVRAALDALVGGIEKCPEMQVTGEVEVDVCHQVYSNIPLDNVKRLYSHPQVWGQVSQWLTAKMSHVQLVDADSTSQAVAIAKQDDAGAAIAGKAAGAAHGMTPVVSDVADRHDNATRFLVISKGGPSLEPEGGEDRGASSVKKMMMSFVVNRTLLSSAVGALAAVKLTFLTSRPRGNWTYLYIAEFEGTPQDSAVAGALERLREVAEVTVIGTFTAAAAAVALV